MLGDHLHQGYTPLHEELAVEVDTISAMESDTKADRVVLTVQTDAASLDAAANEPFVVAFVNNLSGGKNGQRVADQLAQLLPPGRVFNPIKTNPVNALRELSNVRNLRCALFSSIG